MANMANTDVVVVGPEETLTKIKKLLRKHLENILNENSKGWFDFLFTKKELETIKDKRSFLYYLGKVYKKNDSHSLHFALEDAWGAKKPLLDLISKKYDVEVFFCCEEPSGDVFEIRDPEREYFERNYYIDFYCEFSRDKAENKEDYDLLNLIHETIEENEDELLHLERTIKILNEHGYDDIVDFKDLSNVLEGLGEDGNYIVVHEYENVL